MSVFQKILLTPLRFRRWVSYVQGQSMEPKIREYFYYIDHQGMLFLDDVRIKNFTSCFKDKKFLIFFFKRLQRNRSGRYETDFPYLSLCGNERNFVRCDDLPIVYTQVLSDKGVFRFSYNHTGEGLSVPFEPNKVIMLPKTGRVYHPGPEKLGGIGLVKSSLAIEFSKYFEFGKSEEEPPTHFQWDGVKYELVKWYKQLPPDS